MRSSWIDADANLAHQVARAVDAERLAGSLGALAARGVPKQRRPRTSVLLSRLRVAHGIVR